MKYRYTGPISGVTLKDGMEVMLYDGMEVDLPAENKYVKTLVARRHLTEVSGEPPQPSNEGAAADVSLNSAEAEGNQRKVKITKKEAENVG